MITSSGFVAFLDVLGFKQWVAHPDFERLAQRYVEIIDGSVLDPLDYDLASDSAIIFVQGGDAQGAGDSAMNLLRLIETVGAIQHSTLVELGLPIRGGITHGTYGVYVHPSQRKLVAGPAVVAAYQLEQLQDWIGIALSPHIMELQPTVLRRLQRGVVNSVRAQEEKAQYLSWNKSARVWGGPIPKNWSRWSVSLQG